MKQADRVLFHLLVLLMCVSCAVLGLTEPKTFNQRLAYAYSSVTSVRTIAKDLLVSGSITAKDATEVQSGADAARSALDAANVASLAGDTDTAEGRLTAAQSLLTTLQAYLKSKGGSL